MNINTKKTWAVRAVRGILFLLVLAAMVLGLNRSLLLMQEDNLCGRYYRYPKNTFDVVFLGASLVLYGIYPIELYGEYGMAAYSLSTGNQSLEASYYLAKEAIEKDHPSLIVMDCGRAWDDEETMKTQYIHYITDTMPCLSGNRFEMISNLTPAGEDRKPLLFPLIEYHSRWQELTYEDALPQAKEMVYGAKVTSRLEYGEPFDAPQIMEHVVSDTSRKYIQKTIDLCKENDTELLLLTMPVIAKNKFFDQHGYDLRASAAREVAQLAEENGVLFANYFDNSGDFGFDLSRDVMDGEHLNRWGAAKFTRGLGQFIKEHYDIPDRRGTGGAYDTIEKDLAQYPKSRMKDSLNRALFLRDYASALRSDLIEEPVEDVLVLVTLNGMVEGEILTEEDAALLQRIGISQDLHSWKGHGWLAVIEDGSVIYESSPAGAGDAAGETAEDAAEGTEKDAAEGSDGAAEFVDFADSCSGTAGKLQYEVTSGRVDEETGEVHSGASIRVNGLEYTTEDRGLHFAVFEKSTGKLMDSCRLNIYSRALDCDHDNH